ncbi:MAG: TolC family outer membrane protein [Rhodospirillales bacterium]|nr:TolC family outer membrane protein [Rhodospirillales bacterium]
MKSACLLLLPILCAAVVVLGPDAYAQSQTEAAGSNTPNLLTASEMDMSASTSSRSTTLEEVLSKTYLYNPSLQAARAALKTTEESLPQARAGWKPTITTSAGISVANIDGSAFGPGDGTIEKDIGIGLSQPVFRGGRTTAAIRTAKHTIEAQTAVFKQAVQDVLLSATQAYMDVLRDRSLLRLSEKNYEVLSRQLDATRQRYDVGELTLTDVAQAEARLSGAEADRINVAGTLKITLANYERLVGAAAPEVLMSPAKLPVVPNSLEEAQAIAAHNAPAIAELTARHAAAERNVEEVFGEALPEVRFSADWSRSYDPQPGIIDESTNASAGLTASIPLYQGGAVASRIRQSKHQANQIYLETLDVRTQIQEQVVAAWEQLQTAHAEIKARQKQVDSARIAKEGVYQEEQLGIRTILDTLDADQELLDSEVSYVSAQRNEIVARFVLARALGQLTPETLGLELNFSSSTTE